MSRRPLSLVVALVVGAAVTGFGYAVAPVTTPTPLGPGEVTVQVDIEHSRFVPDLITVTAGTRVRFLIVNGDPIHHEFITGGPEVHIRHAEGTEAEHPSVPGEVSVEPNGRRITTFVFDRPGQFAFACHLPGHFEYGMHGIIEVVEPST